MIKNQYAILFFFVIFFAPGCRSDQTSNASSTPINWESTSKTVASAAFIELAFNNTPLGGRDNQETWHMALTNGSSLYHVSQELGDSAYNLQSLSKGIAGSQVNKPTLAINDNIIVVAWSEYSGQSRTLFVTRSQDYGQNWDSLPLSIVSGHISSSVSLHIFKRSNQTSGIVLAWTDEDEARVKTRAWKGNSWSSSDWTTIADLSTLAATSEDVSVRGNGNTVWAAWDDSRSSGLKEIYLNHSTDGGLTWSGEQVIPLQEGDSPTGNDPSIRMSASGLICLTFQTQMKVYLTCSEDGGASFAALTRLGDGLFGHVALNDRGVIAVSWESFLGDLYDDSIKTVGLAVSTDTLATISGPHAMPDSASMYHAVQSSVMVSENHLDVVWIDSSDSENNLLRHYHATLSY